ncbi:MAG: hypothetical protein KGI29_09815 [Pseudomonadota bacterium]|nr:hypothetical protein [Pseudomonadota bacterium]
MPYQSEEDRVRHEADIRRHDIIWEKYKDHMIQTDMGAVDIGLAALKTIVFINVGALVSLITFIGQLWTLEANTVNLVLHASYSFVLGAVLGGCAFIAAYFYQSAITGQFHVALSEFPLSKKPTPKKLRALIIVMAVAMILLPIASLGEFACGASKILHIFEDAASVRAEADKNKQMAVSNPKFLVKQKNSNKP